MFVACATDKTKLRLSPSTKQHQNPCCRVPPVYLDLSSHHDWSVEKVIDDLPIRLKGNAKRTSVNLLSLLGAENKDLSAASQTLLTRVKLCLRLMLLFFSESH